MPGSSVFRESSIGEDPSNRCALSFKRYFLSGAQGGRTCGEKIDCDTRQAEKCRKEANHKDDATEHREDGCECEGTFAVKKYKLCEKMSG